MKGVKSILVVGLSLLVLLGSSGLLLDAHYCQGKLKHISVFVEASSCHGQQSCHEKAKSCCSDMQTEEGCCHNETTLTDLDVDYPSSNALEKEVVSDSGLLVVTHDLNEIQVDQNIREDFYDPPPIVRDFRALFQIYRC